MMDEKTMVADTLAGINGELVRYGEMISQSGNKQLKETLKQMRNQCETSQEEIYHIAREKGYYVPAAEATREEVDHVRSVLTQGQSMKQSQGMGHSVM
ncbi:spore coat protein [Blautia schinkii]|nr:spore coat protein [Blautia schinkii]